VPAEAALAGEAAPVFAAKGGEDYELLAVLPRDFAGGAGFPLREVGEVVAGQGLTLELSGRPVVLAGYEHFA
jgi:thiamine monophosphate kinase